MTPTAVVKVEPDKLSSVLEEVLSLMIDLEESLDTIHVRLFGSDPINHDNDSGLGISGKAEALLRKANLNKEITRAILEKL